MHSKNIEMVDVS